jgi:hypothetical protein
MAERALLVILNQVSDPQNVGAAQYIVEIERLEWFGLKRQALMHRLLAQQRGKTGAIKDADRLAIAASRGTRRRDERLCFLLLSR